MRQQESIPVPRGWTGRAAWRGAGASLLLHLFVGAAVIVVLSGPPKSAPRVIDLTLLPPAGIDRRPVPRTIVPAYPKKIPGTSVLPEPPALPAPQAVANPTDMIATANPSDMIASANPSDMTASANPSDPGVLKSAPGAGSPLPPSASPAAAGQGPATAAPGSSHGTPGAGTGPPAADFAWIRDAIQGAIAYPATARRMGWEGKVVVSFQILSDGSVRDVRVVQGSGHAALGRGAVDAVRNASPFPRSPVEAKVITPVVYRLTTR